MDRKSCVTLKQRADFPPAGDASFAGELAQGRLQEKNGNPAAHKEDNVGDEERSLMHTKRECKNSSESYFCSKSHFSATQSRSSIYSPASLDFFFGHFLFKGLNQRGLPPPFL